MGGSIPNCQALIPAFHKRPLQLIKCFDDHRLGVAGEVNQAGKALAERRVGVVKAASSIVWGKPRVDMGLIVGRPRTMERNKRFLGERMSHGNHAQTGAGEELAESWPKWKK